MYLTPSATEMRNICLPGRTTRQHEQRGRLRVDGSKYRQMSSVETGAAFRGDLDPESGESPRGN